jgi:hypothetical protein
MNVAYFATFKFAHLLKKHFETPQFPAKLRSLPRLLGPSCQMSLLEILDQALIFRDLFWASLSSATLDFK